MTKFSNSKTIIIYSITVLVGAKKE